VLDSILDTTEGHINFKDKWKTVSVINEYLCKLRVSHSTTTARIFDFLKQTQSDGILF
jgi:hypothetical protein